MPHIRPGDQRGIGELLRDLAGSAGSLLHQEITLARTETASSARSLGVGTLLVGAGGVLMLLGLLAAITGVILLPGDQWLRDRYWLAALMIFALTGGTAMLLAMRSAALLKPSRLAPNQTVQTLKEDKEWLKQQLT